MKKIILILLAAFALGGCFKENADGCPTDMRLRFILDDRRQPGDYDSRIGSDVLLYIFKDKILTYKTVIPYEQIMGGREYVLRKTPEISGNIDMVAWAQAADDPGADNRPVYSIADRYDDLLINHEQTRALDCKPVTYKRFLGSVSNVEAIDRETSHTFAMQPAACRIEVYVTDQSGEFNAPQADPHVRVNGVMSEMNLYRQGVGHDASVRSALDCPSGDGESYTTGCFGVLPSAQGQTLSIDVMQGNNTLATLTVPRENLPRGAEMGELLIFDYALDATEFSITVDGFTQKIVIVDEI